MKIHERKIYVFSHSTQAFSGNGHAVTVSVNAERGRRIALVRRLLGTAIGQDLTPPKFAQLLGYKPNAAYRWETGEDRPREGAVDKMQELCRQVGIPITASWIERGGEPPQLGSLLESALSPASATVHAPPKRGVRRVSSKNFENEKAARKKGSK